MYLLNTGILDKRKTVAKLRMKVINEEMGMERIGWMKYRGTIYEWKNM